LLRGSGLRLPDAPPFDGEARGGDGSDRGSGHSSVGRGSAMAYLPQVLNHTHEATSSPPCRRLNQDTGRSA
jgi:hypothetical protein